MNETTKTLVFLAVGGIALIAAFATQHPSADLDLPSLVGEKLGNFDPEDAKQLKIIQFDEDTATLREFEVAQDDTGLWTLPSKDGYPADAERQMGEATASLLDREILAVVSNSAAEHEQFSVVDPDPRTIEAGQKGVGTRVTVSDIRDNALVDLIIGGEVKDFDDQRYVREAKRDMVYVIDIDPTKLSTKFEDWIESDLLQLNSWDIQQVAINDYSADLVLVNFQPQIEWDRRGNYTLRYDESDAKWIAESLQTYDRESNEFVDAPLAENEELDADKLRELKNALDDLKIVDVEKKPSGLSANLKAGDNFLKDNEAVSSLVQRGFTAVPLKSNELEILSSEGEVTCTMKNGVEYVMRFGNLQVQVDANESDVDADQSDEEKSSDEGVNRYLFVMVRHNEDAVAKPELAELPELPDSANAEAADEESTLAGNDTADPISDVENSNDEVATDVEAATEDEGDEPDTEDDSEGTEDTGAPDDGDESVTEDDEEEDDLSKVIEERKRIEEENQRKLDEYKEKLDEGREKVKELNIRFGDWYYVISNDVFQKIRLTRDDVVKEKEASDDEEEATDDDSSDFGEPGTTVPGLPGINP